MSRTPVRTTLDRREAAAVGMALAVTAREAPDRPAIVSPHGDRSFEELNARVNRLVRCLRGAGLSAGDSVALVCANRPEFAEAFFAAQRAGLRLTPINWHLGGEEIAYILDDCEAAAWIGDARFAPALVDAAARARGARLRLAVGGKLDGFDDYDSALAPEREDDVEDPVLGSQMLYTSGTTGRPKGVYRRQPPRRRPGQVAIARSAAYRPGESAHLATGPLYHAAPLGFSLSLPLGLGCTVVMMDGWDPERALALIEGHRISHTHMVPTMFHQLLALPEASRAAHDLSSLQMVIHGAAPCPVDVKRRIIEWLGPVVYEYYAATEGWGSFVDSAEWLARPGTVGRPADGQVRILDEQGEPVAPGVEGLIFMHAGERFEYFGDEQKTRSCFRGDHFTLGDVGYLDADGWLYLCDRSADLIISGGVNIYPAEVDAVLLTHDAIRDAATIGVPDEKWGESVLAVVELRDGIVGDEALAGALIDYCRERLAHFKCPRFVAWSDGLPRFETGKIYRRVLREQYRMRGAEAARPSDAMDGSKQWT